jgi:methanethiol S-methyltransferase
MEAIIHMRYVILSVLVISWCFMHSAMISVSVTEYLNERLGALFRFYRLFFNLVSALTLVPVVLYASAVRTEPLFSWDGYMRIIQVLLLVTAALLFFLGSISYDAARFLGFKQIREGISNKGITDNGELGTSGVLSIMRHPWYLATMLLIWARQLDISAILVNVILTSYLIVGTYLEEKKLVREFGEKYRTYQKRVSMLIPYKWLKSKITK